ncbi:5-(carboxyamino)imidazole ribonucleotide synthase [soil metagenome]
MAERDTTTVDPHRAVSSASGVCVGVLGGGQLARMLAIAGAPIGVRVVQLTPDPDARDDVAATIRGDYTDIDALNELAARAQVVTYETENVPPAAVQHLHRRVQLLPPPPALVLAADRWAEKELFTRLGIPSAAHARIVVQDDLGAALHAIGLPAVVKTRHLGYDGKGQTVCRTEEELLAAWHRLGAVPLLCERYIPFEREISIIAVRSADGEVRCYSPSENVHEKGILRATLAPAPDLSPALRETAASYVQRILEDLDYTGVLALELFQHDDTLLANEIAPRVHNTGHWTIEGADISQFENHLRAVLGWPLGSTANRGHSVMVNLIGDTPPMIELLAVSGAHVHMYGKRPRPGRKLGHVSIAASSDADAREKLTALRRLERG